MKKRLHFLSVVALTALLGSLTGYAQTGTPFATHTAGSTPSIIQFEDFNNGANAAAVAAAAQPFGYLDNTLLNSLPLTQTTPPAAPVAILRSTYRATTDVEVGEMVSGSDIGAIVITAVGTVTGVSEFLYYTVNFDLAAKYKVDVTYAHGNANPRAIRVDLYNPITDVTLATPIATINGSVIKTANATTFGTNPITDNSLTGGAITNGNILTFDVLTAGTYVVKVTLAQSGPQFNSFQILRADLTTWNGTAWSNGTPDATKDAIIDGDYTGAGFTARKLTVNATKSTTITSGNLVITNEVINNGTLVIENGANLLQDAATVTNANTGAITVKRNSNALLREDYTLWASPVAGQNLLAFSPATLTTRFYTYLPASSQYSVIASPSTTPFDAGKGYQIRMPDNADAVTPTAYPGAFTGVPNNGTVTVALTTGYNLVGNPYPSNISFSTLQAANTELIGSTAYFWRKTNGTVGSAYCTYNVAGPTYVSNGQPGAAGAGTFDGIIQSGQGFFVNASVAGDLTFTNAQRTSVTTNQAFFRTKQVVTADKLWLNATNAAGSFSQMAVTYSDGATSGVDAYDSKSFNDSQYALTSSINEEEYTIQGRPAFDPTDAVALNFKTASAGNYTIALARTEGVFANGQEVYLVDNTTGTETNLKAGDYNFTANAGVDNSRFSLKFQKTLKVNAAAFNENSVTVFSKNGTLYVNSENSTIQNVRVFDIQGRLLAQQNNVKANSAAISNLKANQALIVQVTSEDNTVVSKKVVN